jgi:hypothetical protein
MLKIIPYPNYIITYGDSINQNIGMGKGRERRSGGKRFAARVIIWIISCIPGIPQLTKHPR